MVVFDGVFVVVFWWCFCGGVFRGGVFVVFFAVVWWCFCVFVLVCWCFCGGVSVVVRCVFVVVWWCFCVFVVVFLW